jgi:type VI secretion system lysozyme-like protein
MRFLLERLAVPLQAARGLPQSFDLEAAVAAQIGRIVSARPLDQSGEEETLFGYGMPNVVDLARDNKSQLDCYAARLRRMIARYEPRLREPEVTVEPAPEGPSPWRLVVSGSLPPDDEARTFRFELSDH